MDTYGNPIPEGFSCKRRKRSLTNLCSPSLLDFAVHPLGQRKRGRGHEVVEPALVLVVDVELHVVVEVVDRRRSGVERVDLESECVVGFPVSFEFSSMPVALTPST